MLVPRVAAVIVVSFGSSSPWAIQLRAATTNGYLDCSLPTTTESYSETWFAW
jgi:hypothetical protein